MHTRSNFFSQITLVFAIFTVSTGLSFAQDIDHLVNDMERASIACVDVLIEYRSAKTIVKK